VCIIIISIFPCAAAPAEEPQELRLTFVGDIMGHDVNYQMKDFNDIYSSVKDVFLADDLTFANLEFPLDPFRPRSGYPTFNGTLAYLSAAVGCGFNLFSLANNHAFDWGTEGVSQTIRALEGARALSAGPFAFSGTRNDLHRPFDPATLNVKGVRIGFIAVAQFLNNPNGGGYVNVVDYSETAQVNDFLTFVRSVAPQFDLFIVSYHGDKEYVQETDPLKRVFFHQLLEAGAHIVVGHHPHVVQGYDLVQVNGSQRLAMYSMGNFISGMTWMLSPAQLQGVIAATGESYMLTVEVRCDAEGCSVRRAEAIPIANYMNERSEMVVARMSDLASGTIKLSSAWQEYYAVRLSLMNSFLLLNASNGNSPRSAAAP
jgi:poly-gamma-glutamate synthesis protein (capsule biosynthesis protein)